VEALLQLHPFLRPPGLILWVRHETAGSNFNRGHETENKKTVRWRSGTVRVQGRVEGRVWGMGYGEEIGELGRGHGQLASKMACWICLASYVISGIHIGVSKSSPRVVLPPTTC